MNNVYIINSLEGGGAERVFAQLTELLASDKNKVVGTHVVLLDKVTEVYPLPNNLKVHRIGRRPGVIGSALQFLKLLRLLSRLRPTVIVSFLTRANAMNVVSAKLLHCGSIISERSNTNGRLKPPFIGIKRFLVSTLYRRANLVIAVSQGVANCLVSDFGVAAEKVIVVNNPVDLRKINSLASEDSTPSIKPGIVAMGRLVKSKGFANLITAYAQSGLSCGLTILGDGPERARLQVLVDRLGVSSDIRFLGFVSNPYPEIQQAALFVLCSHLEGFPNALVEAMALGTAVIATDCADGPREILSLDEPIANGEFKQTRFGLMVNVDDNHALSDALVNLYSSASLREELATQARARVTQFSINNFYTKFSNLVVRVNDETNEHV